MNEAATSAAVRQWIRAPLRWSLLLALVLSPLVVLDVREALTGAVPSSRAATVPATVGADYSGRGEVPVAYRHPVTRQQVRTDVRLHDRALRPRAGQSVRVVADEHDPTNVLLAGDRFPAEQNPLAYGWLPLVPVAVSALRASRAGRIRRLLGAAAPSFGMLGAVTAPRGFGRRPLLHLYPLDAGPGEVPVCVVPLAATGGAPLAGPVVPVEVKGSPAPGGRVVARAGDRLLWPAGRAFTYARHARPRPVRVEEVAAATSVPAAQRPQVLSLPQPPPLWWLGWRALMLGAAALLALVVAAMTLAGAREAAALYAQGDPVLADVVAADVDGFELRVEYRRDGRPQAADADESDSEPYRAIAPVDYPEDYQVDLLYPAVVDPDDPGLVRLLAEPYDAVEPVVLGTLPLVGLLALTAGAARAQRQVRRARGSTPVDVRAWREQDHLALALPGTDQVLCLVPVWDRHLAAVVPFRGWVAVTAAGNLMPDQAVALSAGGAWLAVAGRATASSAHDGTLEIPWR